MKFLILYDENTGRTISIKQYLAGQEDQAFKDFKAAGIANFGKKNIQVHLIGAKDEAELRRGWGRFFREASTVGQTRSKQACE